MTHRAAMSLLDGDELDLILNWIHDPEDRKSFSLVCKHWFRIESLNRSSFRLLEPDSLLRLLHRFPNLLCFETTESITDLQLELLAQKCPGIKVINLSLETPAELSYGFQVVGDVSGKGLAALASKCSKLTNVSLRRRNRIGDAGVVSLVSSAPNLKYLDLGYCSWISDHALEAIGRLSFISVLNLHGCWMITDSGLSFLAKGSCSKPIKKLVLAECNRITDSGVLLLKQMCCLEELNLCACGPKITDVGGVAVAEIRSLRELNLSRLDNVSDRTVAALADNCVNLEVLDLTGCQLVSGTGLRAFSNHMRVECLVLRSCLSLNLSDVTHIVLGCRSLKSVVVDKRLRMRFLQMQETISRVVGFV